jgi:hypothetical protein
MTAVSLAAAALFVLFLLLPWDNATFLMPIATVLPGSQRWLPAFGRPTPSPSSARSHRGRPTADRISPGRVPFPFLQRPFRRPVGYCVRPARRSACESQLATVRGVHIRRHWCY